MDLEALELEQRRPTRRVLLERVEREVDVRSEARRADGVAPSGAWAGVPARDRAGRSTRETRRYSPRARARQLTIAIERTARIPPPESYRDERREVQTADVQALRALLEVRRTCPNWRCDHGQPEWRREQGTRSKEQGPRNVRSPLFLCLVRLPVRMLPFPPPLPPATVPIPPRFASVEHRPTVLAPTTRRGDHMVLNRRLAGNRRRELAQNIPAGVWTSSRSSPPGPRGARPRPSGASRPPRRRPRRGRQSRARRSARRAPCPAASRGRAAQSPRRGQSWDTSSRARGPNPRTSRPSAADPAWSGASSRAMSADNAATRANAT